MGDEDLAPRALRRPRRPPGRARPHPDPAGRPAREAARGGRPGPRRRAVHRHHRQPGRRGAGAHRPLPRLRGRRQRPGPRSARAERSDRGHVRSDRPGRPPAGPPPARGLAVPRLLSLQRARPAPLPARPPPLPARAVRGARPGGVRGGPRMSEPDPRLDRPPGLAARLVASAATWIFPMRGGRPRPDEVRRVLVVRTDDRVGNALLTVHLALALREILPAARVDLLLARRRAAVAQGLPGVNVVPFEKTDAFQHPLRFLGFLRDLRRPGYDVVIDAAHWHAFSLTSALLAPCAARRWLVGA